MTKRIITWICVNELNESERDFYCIALAHVFVVVGCLNWFFMSHVYCVYNKYFCCHSCWLPLTVAGRLVTKPGSVARAVGRLLVGWLPVALQLVGLHGCCSRRQQLIALIRNNDLPLTTPTLTEGTKAFISNISLWVCVRFCMGMCVLPTQLQYWP